MRVAEIVLDVPRRRQLDAERAAYALGAQGLELRDGTNGRIHVVLWLPSSTPKRVVHAALGRVEDARVHLRRIAATWYQPPAPRALGRRFVVTEQESVRGARIPIRVRSPVTFGDGGHVTTALCVEAVERVLGEREARSLLDVGTGTGILAIVAGKLGVERIVATDIDPLAREAARRALRDNDVRARVQTALPARTFDCVVANLYFEPLLALAGELAERIAEDGVLIVSGFTREAEIASAFARAGLAVRRTRKRDGWICLELTRPRRSGSAQRRRRR